MKFLIFNGSLKADAESNTFSVCKMYHWCANMKSGRKKK
jgi:hypothetical protein